MGFLSRHIERDLSLPSKREILLKNALTDLTKDSNVLAIYQSGSLSKGSFDRYSDIDLHIVVTPDKKADFIKDKRSRVRNWGNVLFFEGVDDSPVLVTHYDCFVKLDSWYKTSEEIVTSLWLKGNEVHYDPHKLISVTIEESSKLVYKTTAKDVEFWREKMLAFIHETYRAVMRDEMYYALANVDKIRWLIVSGWYMETEQHLDSSYGIWSKIEGKKSRTKLNKSHLSLLEGWNCKRNPNEIINTMVRMIPEFFRLNKSLSKKVDIAENEETLKRIIEMAY